VEGLFTVLMCADYQAARGHGSGPYPVMTRAQLREGLDLLPTGRVPAAATEEHNLRRLHSTNDYLPPLEWEQRHHHHHPLPSTLAA
jgi:hypothetical protein